MKLFKKIAVLSASLAMVVASGLVIGKTGMESASAAEEVIYSLDTTTVKGDSSTSGYATISPITVDGIEWQVMGNLNINPWRLGGKSLNNVDRVVYTQTAIEASITKVDVIIGKIDSTTINSATFSVFDTAEYASTGENAIYTQDLTIKQNSTINVECPTEQDWTSKFYRLVFNLTITATKNKYVQLNGMKFYANIDEAAPRIEITNKVDKLAIGDSLTLTKETANDGGAAVTWTSSNVEVATVNNEGVVNALAVGTTTIKASMTVNEVEYSDSFELLVNVPHVDHSPVVLPESGKTYKLGFIPVSGKVAYFTGEMSSYYAVASDFSYEGIDVIVEKSAEGWAIKYGEKYVLPAISGTYINFKYSDTLTCYATYMINYNTFRWVIGSKDVFLGSSGTYGTGGGYAWSKVGDTTKGKESLPMHLLEPAATAIAPTDKEVVDFFVNEYMHKEVALTDVGTGLCKTNNWYAFAKEAYTSLTEAQKTLFVTDASYNDYLARYNAWAVANGDSVIAAGALSQASTRNNVIKTNNDMMIIVIISVAAAISFAGLFVFLKKRKANR